MPTNRQRSPAEGPAGEIEHLAQRLDAVLSTLLAGVMEADLSGRVTYANPAALRTLGLTADQLIGRTFGEMGIGRHDLTGRRVDDRDGPAIMAVHGGPGIPQSVFRYTLAIGADVWLESQAAPMISASGAVVGTVVSFVDVTDRFVLEAARRDAEERLNAVLSHMAAGVMMLDADGRIEYANAAAAGISGLQPEDVIGQLAADPSWRLTDEQGRVLPYDALPVPTALRERREVRDAQIGAPGPDGQLRWLRVSVAPVFNADGSLRGAVVTTEDVTDRRVLADQLLQSQKLEGIGQLAGGIAHDFNNLLTTIMGNAELAGEAALPGSELAGDLAEIHDAAVRGAALTRQVLTFARKQVVQPRAVYLDRLAAGAEKLLHRVLGDHVTLRRESDADLWAVMVDPGHMEQVIVNMAINARDAMPDGGVLSIYTRNHVVDARTALAYPGVVPGEFVTLSVADTGVGMTHAILTRAFEPFFTTKADGLGSGLGLSICHGVVNQARGFISVESAPARGTTFRVHIPRAPGAVVDVAASEATPLARGTGIILLVEDEDSVRSLVSRALGAHGYEVLSAGSGLEALALHARTGGHVDLLITDVVMPGMRGPDVASALLARQPGLRVLFISGYNDLTQADEQGLSPEDNLLAKPFTPMQLLRRVQGMLRRR